ncbi:MAG: hypothetical protein AB9873_09680 [Syntrophobacteraceae bacterium]
MFWIAVAVALGLLSGLLIMLGVSLHAVEDYDDHMPDIEGLLR